MQEAKGERSGSVGTGRLFAFRGTLSARAYAGIALTGVLCLLLLWELAAAGEWVPSAFMPSPLTVVREGTTMFRSPLFLQDIGFSVARILAAFTVAAILAIPLGIAMSSFRVVEAAVEPLVDFIRYVPVPALLPMFIVWTGIGETSKFLVLFFGTFFQLVLLIMDDAKNVPGEYFDLVRTLGASTPQMMRDVLLPYLMPQIYDRLRITLGWCWTYLIIAELIATDRGLGHTIKEAQRFGATSQIFVCFIVLGVIGLCTDYIAKFGYSVLFPYAERKAR